MLANYRGQRQSNKVIKTEENTVCNWRIGRESQGWVWFNFYFWLGGRLARVFLSQSLYVLYPKTNADKCYFHSSVENLSSMDMVRYYHQLFLFGQFCCSLLRINCGYYYYFKCPLSVEGLYPRLDLLHALLEFFIHSFIHFLFPQFFVRSFPLVNDRVREALGDTFYEEFMVSASYFSVVIRQLKPTVNFS